MDFKQKTAARWARACGLAVLLAAGFAACNEEPVGPGEHAEEGAGSQARLRACAVAYSALA